MTIAESPATTARGPATARALENAVFSAAMLAHRLPWTDVPARALGLDALTREGVTSGLLAHLRRTRSGRPVRLRTAFGTFLVPSSRVDAAGLLARAEEAGVLGTPCGLTAGGLRYGLSPHVPLGREVPVARGQWAALVAEDVDGLIAARRGDGTVDWHEWRRGMARVARRVVVGAAAAEDTLLSEIVARASTESGSRSHAARTAALGRRLAPYLADADPDSPAGWLVADGAGPETAAAALAHALGVVGEAAAGATLQALALLSVGAVTGAGEAVGEALRRYPAVPAAVYPVSGAFVWEDTAVEAGTEILWAPGWARDEDHSGAGPSPLCGAPSGCAAARFAEHIAREVVGRVTEAVHPVVISPRFGADRLPEVLDPGTLLVAFREAEGLPGDGRVTVGLPAAVPLSARGFAPAAYGALAHAGADRLERHSESLAACAGNGGWDVDEAGEAFRMTLLGHAERCARAADDVRRAAKRLAG
ncbi:hypothetical protein [Streptomyces sp. A1136]|uniref:hypothetical protein n=1 Tax=Streptomyces sp. A1136 TaxID=2563102 RepID=UPI00109E446D|nr:hypothetical protein [Streptomyces sp. A1136]THA52873.1 hypothetical protein E6R62_19575 [Streptomyces sp. A1136]